MIMNKFEVDFNMYIHGSCLCTSKHRLYGTHSMCYDSSVPCI